jgi:hypothetical protein
MSLSMGMGFRMTMRPQISLIDIAYQRICRTARVHAEQFVDLGFEPIVIFLRSW